MNNKFPLMMPSPRSSTRGRPLREPVEHTVRLLRKAEDRRTKPKHTSPCGSFLRSAQGRTRRLRPWAPSIQIRDWLLPRVLELTYTAWNLKAFAEDCDDDGPPFIWDPERRLQLRCEIDAAFFHLYGISQDDTAYILDTFPVLAEVGDARVR